MKSLHSLRFSLILALPIAILSAAENPPMPPRGPAAYVLLAPAEIDRLAAAVRAADDERVAATMAADPARMDAIFSDQLHYAHSNGKIDTKKSYVESLLSRSTVYTGYDYKKRDFLVAAPDIVIMTAHVIIKAGSPTAQNTNDLNILAVWRREDGQWRFLAWQSCKNPPPAAK